jgi:cytochrome c oxidase cbb3-type subunit III
MADFTSGFWTWFISLLTIVSIVGLFIFLIKCSSRKTGSDADKVETMGHVWDENLEEYNNPLPRWWYYWFVFTLIWGAVYLIFYPGLGSYAGVLGWTQADQFNQEMQSAKDKYGPLYEQFRNTDIAALSKDDAALKVGERLYASYCTTCHGSDARGARGYPNLRDDDWLYSGEPEGIKTTIMNGRVAAMPPWAGLLSNEDVFNVASHVEQLAGREVDSMHASLGGGIFKQNCAMCHGAEGKGNPLFGAPNLTDDIWLYGGSQKKITESINLGRSGTMPPHKEFLGEAKVHILAAYIYSLSN